MCPPRYKVDVDGNSVRHYRGRLAPAFAPSSGSPGSSGAVAELIYELPETTAFAEKMAALIDGPPTFYDLDVIDDRG
jgi:hypothetical protein